MKVTKQRAEQNARPSLHRRCKFQYPYFRRTGQRTLNDLPNEMLLQIFSHVSTYDLFANVRPVCKRFMALTETGALWESMRVSEKVPLKMLNKWLREFGKHVRHFSTADRVDGNEIFNQVSKFCKKLEYISAVNIVGTETSAQVKAGPLCNIIIRCKRLRRIRLRDCSFMSCRFFKLLSKHQAPLGLRAGEARLKRRLEYDGPISRKQLCSLYEALHNDKVMQNCLIVLHRNTHKICINMQRMQKVVKLSRIPNIINSLWTIVNLL